ncbi:phosphatase 2C-like domain-containing protein [Podospora didyma]|uniref:Protein phosphatase n=1 Tax=Podospora didyma TaxID=330526 RepID=A0AAE0U882_9PEZI|nr:phosphatase 2C-like domain-containing protein [Podospora didyma]
MRRLPPRLLASTPHARSRPWLVLRRSAAWQGNISLPQHHGPFSLRQRHLSRLATDPAGFAPLYAKALLSRPLSTTTLASSKTSLPPPNEAGERAVSSRRVVDPSTFPRLPFRFDTGIGLFAKRTPRPFPPPFLSPPSGSFSDPLSTHNRSRDRRPAYVGEQLIQGFTNGDDAVFASDYFICANDGVGAWSTKPRGHAGLWARLILHFWVTAIFEDVARQGDAYKPDPIANLQRAYEQTKEATSAPNDWQGTTTAAGAQLYYRRRRQPVSAAGEESEVVEPLLYVTNLGDSQVMVVRPSTREVVFKTKEEWHWFDCPYQLGTNSEDTPMKTAVLDEVPIREGDVVLAMSDGVIDNLWSQEIVTSVSDSLERWQAGEAKGPGIARDTLGSDSAMEYVAEELMEAAKVIALDPFAGSPYMEHAIDEGLACEGGKLDDISVVAALCRRNDV